MKLTDITVEVRDKNLTRLGMIRHEDLDLELSDLHNNVGSWKLSLAVEHPLAGALRQPGSGIVIVGPDGKEMFSGPTVKNENQATATDPAGTIIFEGVDDTVILGDYLAFPEPGNLDPTKQKLAHDVRTGTTETLMHAYVKANIGPDAPAARRKANLVMGANLGRGRSVTKSARFKVLGNLLNELATVDNLGFRVIQRGNKLAFETYQVYDRSREIRLDVYNNTLAGHKVAWSPPGATQVIVAGQNEGVDRQFRHLTTPESLAAEQDWGRRIERFVDQRQTDKVEELDQAGMEVLSEEGFSTLAVQAVPMEDSPMNFGRDWNVGDRVTVVVEGQELASTVTGYVMKVNREGFRSGALIGDPAGFDQDAAMSKRVANTENRVAQLERNAENNAPGATPLDIAFFAESTPPEGYPLGESLLHMVSAEATSGWPTFAGKGGSVLTLKWTGDDASQVWTRRGTTVTPEQWIRSGNRVNGWSAWKKLAVADDLTLVDNRVKTLEGARNVAPNSISETDPPSKYPLGTSLYSLANASPAWAPGAYGTVVTFNHDGNSRVAQVLHGNEGVAMWKRSYHANNPGGGWSAWYPVVRPWALPDPVNARYNNTNSITATAWANLPNDLVSTLTLPADAIVQVEFGAWLGVPANQNIRVGISHNGANPQDLFGGMWGNVLYAAQLSEQAGGEMRFFSATARLAVGTHTFRAKAYMSGGTGGCNYPMLRVTPIRWAE
ncbi:siphovirus ReqiPepy6 Gp37-like family protein [Micromonospora sp. CB01531]|uniref:siphovirus ReqiPepy6 Gp37-like family protein n=1 Tax=Micromonospora sp. CB01531 TaxID=1718947 RepID=UPI00093A2E5E|nr:siphovirus ReqiPepy6 Gp37-like family protein [Micromonospora sp. CB01531]